MENGKPQLAISISNKLMQDVQCYLDVFGGDIYFDSAKNGCYR